MSKRIRRSKKSLKKTFLTEVRTIVAERNSEDNRPVLIMAEDEGRFGRISNSRSAWAPAGFRPVSARQVIRKFTYVYAAVCPSLGIMTTLILPFANTEMMTIFLDQVSKDFKDFFVIILVDRAGWHISKILTIPENIRLIPQPAHSPELNPVEHIWDEIREKYFYNKAFKSLDDVENVLCKGINRLSSRPEKLKSLTNFSYMNITC